MKLLLTNPNFNGFVSIPSLGLGFIGTYVKKHAPDWEVEIVEPLLQGLNEEQVLEKARKSDIVGLTCYTESRFQTFDFARKVKQASPACKIIVGGPHVNSLDEKILQHYGFIDAVVRGEGEETFLDIVTGVPFAGIKGITWINDGKITRNPPRALIKDIDSLEYDYSLVYHQVKKWKDPEIPHDVQKFNSLPIIASRGCPYKCTFCAANNQWEQKCRYLSPEEMIKRIKHLVDKYNTRYFRFYDALFIGNDERILKFCDLLEKSKLDIHFRIDIRVGTPRHILERLKKAGCDIVGFGVESGSDRILGRVNKSITRDEIDKTVRLCKELNYWIIGFFMISLPDETLRDIKRTFGLLKHFDQINVQFFKLHPNTAFYNELKNAGELDDEVWFNKDYGFATPYGNEIYYCREKFKRAEFFKEEIESLLNYAGYDRALNDPGKTLQSYGLIKGMRILLTAAVNIMLLKSKPGIRIYHSLKNSKIFAKFYRGIVKQ